jgi:hypothetical protein
MGKGSNARPYSIPKEEFNNKWDAIFGKRDIKEQKPSQEPAPKTDEKSNAK